MSPAITIFGMRHSIDHKEVTARSKIGNSELAPERLKKKLLPFDVWAFLRLSRPEPPSPKTVQA